MLKKYILFGEDVHFGLNRPEPVEVVHNSATAAQRGSVQAEVAEFCGGWAKNKDTTALPEHRKLDSYFKLSLSFLILRLDWKWNQHAGE
jgi:hypothetical protein